MNSFCHTNLGTVAAWAFRTIGGLRPLVRSDTMPWLSRQFNTTAVHARSGVVRPHYIHNLMSRSTVDAQLDMRWSATEAMAGDSSRPCRGFQSIAANSVHDSCGLEA